MSHLTANIARLTIHSIPATVIAVVASKIRVEQSCLINVVYGTDKLLLTRKIIETFVCLQIVAKPFIEFKRYSLTELVCSKS